MTLAEHLMENLLETESKLGYTEAAISYNYPPRTLACLLGLEAASRAAIFAEAEKTLAEEPFTGSTVGENGEMLLLTLSPAAVRYAHEVYRVGHPALAAFIRELTAVCTTFFAGRKEVHAVFDKTGRPYTAFAVGGEDFDEIIRFTDREDAPFYCFAYGERPEYHRLLPEDFVALYGEQYLPKV